MNSLYFLNSYKSLLHKHIVRNKFSPLSKEMKITSDLNYLNDLLLKGKLIRGALFLYTYDKFARKINNYALEIALGLELIHTALLIHDDIMDKSTLRRGIESAYWHYRNKAISINVTDPLEYGHSTALVLGDIALLAGHQLIAKNSFILEKDVNSLDYILQEFVTVGQAQLFEFKKSKETIELNLNQIIEIYTYKTARYTISLPIILSAKLCGYNKKTVVSLEKLGTYIGVLFQLKDDEVDLFSNSKISGKAIGNDIKQNKKNIIRYFLLHKTPSEDIKKAHDILDKENIMDKDVNVIISICKKNKIQEKLQNLEKHYAEKAEKVLESLSVNQSFKKDIKNLIHYSLTRSY